MSKLRNEEALGLSEEILKNFELSEAASQQIILKCLRLARLINDLDAFEWLKYEANGYDKTPDGFLTPKSWAATAKSGRRNFKKEEGKKEPVEYAFMETVADLEVSIDVQKKRMQVAYDPNISISSHSAINPMRPIGNANERIQIAKAIQDYTQKIEKVKSRIYEYVVNINYELKFGNITEDIFARKRENVDNHLKEICPDAVKKFISVYENLMSTNGEDWANSVHSCRRILKDVADTLYPPCNQPFDKGGKQIKVGEDQYINRLVIYIEGKSESEKFTSIVGSHLKYIGERIDSICEAANKGSHHEVKLDEAERYIIYTYLILGDILSLHI